MKAQNGELELWIHSFSSSALYDVKWSASRPDRFTLGKEDRFILNRKLEGGGGSTARLDDFLSLLWPSAPEHPGRNCRPTSCLNGPPCNFVICVLQG